MSSSEAPWQPHFESIKLSTLRALGRGAFGEVSLVKASPNNSEHAPAVFALKRTSLANVSEAGLERAQSEAKLLKRLGEEHESILQCFDFRVVQGTNPALELLLEFAPLGDLNGRIKAHKSSEAGQSGGLPEPEVVSYGCDVAAGLAHIHSLNPKVLHRDVKPANVVLFPTADGAGWDRGTPRAKLADFGIAKVLEADGSLAGANTIIGTPHYFSPEICRGENYDERSDAWALGCVIYEMMCLHRPFHEAESNIAVLALRVMEGRYDKEALLKQAGFYNGLLIFALTGLMTLDPQQRSRAVEVTQPLSKLRGEIQGGATETALPWWRVDASRLAAGGECSSPATEVTNCGTVTPGADSWEGAQEVNLSSLSDPQTINPLQETVTSLHRSGMPSPTWKRTSELLLAAEGPLLRERSSPPTMMGPPTVDPRLGLQRERSSPPTMLSPPTVDPRLASEATLAHSQSGPVGSNVKRDRRTSLSPVPDSTYHLGNTGLLEESAEPSAEDLGGTLRLGQETSNPLGATAEFGDTVRMSYAQADHFGSTVELGHVPASSLMEDQGEAAARGMAPSRLAWQGMTGMLDMMSEPPSADAGGGDPLDQTMRSEVSAAGGFEQPSREAAPSAAAATRRQSAPAEEGGDQTFWAEPRIFLRPLWRPEGAGPPPPDAPVMFCFMNEEHGGQQQQEQQQQPQEQPQDHTQHRQPTAQRCASAPPEFAGATEFAETEGPPQSFQPPQSSARAAVGTPGSGRVLTGRGSVLDPAHGWLEVELTIENAAALYAHMRSAPPPAQPQRSELGGIFELTAVS